MHIKAGKAGLNPSLATSLLLKAFDVPKATCGISSISLPSEIILKLDC